MAELMKGSAKETYLDVEVSLEFYESLVKETKEANEE